MPKGPTGQRSVTRALLLESATDAFAERGYHGASIEHISERAGFTRGAFYSNFASKDEIFFALFDERGEQVLDRLRSALSEADGHPHPVDRFVTFHGDGVDEEEERRWYLLTTEFTLYAIREPQAAAALALHDARIRDELATILQRLMAMAGRELMLDPTMIARMATAMREGAGAQSHVEPRARDPKMLERLFVPAMLAAFSRPTSEKADRGS